jgi:hypothetical protein
MAVSNDDATKQIFSRCLLNCLQIPLWYVTYITFKWHWLMNCTRLILNWCEFYVL